MNLVSYLLSAVMMALDSPGHPGNLDPPAAGGCVCVQMSEVHPFRFRLVTVDRVYRFATDTSGT